jgi:hypothetical protein
MNANNFPPMDQPYLESRQFGNLGKQLSKLINNSLDSYAGSCLTI